MLQNLITLKKGVNKIVIEQDDLGVLNQKYSIARIPVGLSLLNLRAEVDQAFVGSAMPSSSGATVHQADVNVYSMSYRFSIGTKEDPDYFLSEINPTVPGVYGANSGDYFSSPTTAEVPINVHLKSNVIPRTWTFGGDLNTARSYISGCGNQSAALSFGGSGPSVVTEEYDGSSWTASNNLNTARDKLGGCGTQTAGLSIGGDTGTRTAVTEEYGGTSWVNSNNLNTVRSQSGAAGTQTAGLSFGGYATIEYSSITEEYDGTSWIEGNGLNTGRRGLNGCGTQTAALSFGGYDSTFTGVCEGYDGSTWSAANSLNIGRNHAATAGTQTAALSIAGYDGTQSTSTTEEYNGTSWAISNSSNIIGYSLWGCGSQSIALKFGGVGSSASITEEYNEIDISTIAITGKMVLNFTLI